MDKLRTWRTARQLNFEAAGKMLGVSGVAWARYEKGRIPRPEIMRKIEALTEGMVRPADFYTHTAAAA